ncbi:uncharacterized protein LY79DRAFT_675144 [Colletotrichum navitas]|uniref:Uncharacterized protein n=1 Tax=Colletotrichum navitas TaxID=681940 RepID=A0AAD8UWV9_9PEZI|nr:uncharacterized protein LY79DRAFT_675144 [Colletotrichum navitas]KAK1564294.1 hypothetical protein LY79DRAFT_675144 [Colletotrichum navitas]
MSDTVHWVLGTHERFSNRALVSGICALIQQVSAYGLWDSFGPAADETQPPLKLWAKHNSRTAEQQAIGDIRNTTARLRSPALTKQEIAAVGTMAAARLPCRRLSTFDSAVQVSRLSLCRL